MKTRFPQLLISAMLAPALLSTGCSLDVLPIHSVRLNSARLAMQPLQRGPAAAGAFKKSWNFNQPGGFRYDPTKIEIRQGAARLKPTPSPGRELAFSRDWMVLETSSGRPYEAIDGFKEVLGPSHKGTVKYQLSNDGTKWFFHDGTAWTLAIQNPEKANSALDLNIHITNFHSEVGPGMLYVKAFLMSPSGSETLELKGIEVSGIAPMRDAGE